MITEQKYLIILFLMFIASCNTSEISPEEIYMGYHYYPLDIGSFREYEVNENNWPSGIKTESEYYIREVVEDTFSDQNGNTGYIIRRYRRGADSLSWNDETTETWTAKRTNTAILQNENNINYVKLIFPVKREMEWDGNAFNSMDSMIYSLQEVHQPYQSGEGTYDSSITVVKEDFKSLVEKDVANEVYVKNIGLVYREDIHVDFVNDSNDPFFGLDSVTGGSEIILRLINYGKE